VLNIKDSDSRIIDMTSPYECYSRTVYDLAIFTYRVIYLFTQTCMVYPFLYAWYIYL